MSFLSKLAGGIPVVGGAVSALLDAIGGQQNQNAEQAQRGLENQFLANTDKAKADAVAALKAHGIDIFGPQTETGTSFGNSTTSGSSRTVSDQSFRNNPFVTAEYKAMEGRLKDLINGRLNAPETVTQAEKAAQIRNINAASAGALASIRNLAGHGISAQQIAAAGAPVQVGRAGAIGNYLATLPDIERNRRNQDLQLGQGLVGQFGLGQEGTSHGVSTTNSNQSTASSGGNTMTGGPNYSAIQAFTLPTAPMQTMNTGASPWLKAGSDLTGALSQWYANKGGAGNNAYDDGMSPAPWSYLPKS